MKDRWNSAVDRVYEWYGNPYGVRGPISQLLEG
eukprot:COSAG02_NODE_39505_length_416_cov_0.952681_1_plen_32_part_01